MSEYNPKRGPDWNYRGKNWKLSRSKIDLYIQCPRCFYIDNKLGTKRPPTPPFRINSAVDNQLKQEFDLHRAKDTQHPMQAEYGIDAKPAQHEKINTWRNNFEGVQYLHEPTNLLISGAIDDLWINDKSEYIVVDYKATAKNRDDAVRELNDSVWHQAYKRQMEVYQWLLRHNDLKVSDTGYFVYCTGIYDQESFDKKIEFEVNLIPYQGNDDWIEDVIFKIHKCLESDTIPESSQGCELCMYFKTRQEKEKDKQDEALFQKAKRIALNTGKISASTLQKKLRISFAQSARILDMLEKAGVINPTTKVD